MTSHQISIAEWRERLKSEKAEDLIMELIERIERSKYNAFISINKDAIERAGEFDRGKVNGKLAGIPVAVKDNISTGGLLTTCGSKILYDYIPPFDAHVVERLKSEGAIIIGKTNMDEFGMGTTTETSYFGVVRNPHDPERVAGGSSGGSAACLSVGEGVISLGSDTGGSIRCPSSFCGVVGLKPTYGLVSRYGLIPYANSLEQIGPLATCVDDLALLLEVIAGKDQRDSTNSGKEFVFDPELLNGKKLTVGIIREMSGNDDVMSSFNEAVEVIKSLGHSIKEVSMPSFKYALAAYYIIAMSEASSNLARYDGVRYGHTLEQITSWNKFFSAVRAEGFGDEVKRRIMLGSYALSAGYYGKYYLKALKVRTLVIRDFKRAFKECNLLISPTMPALAFKIGELADPLTMYKADVNTVPINLAGVPSLSLPIFERKRLPVGMQIIGNYFEENSIIAFARKVEAEINEI
jgi:aspartyl-tRNA(Asn)/glutamyl-tRNA(Gln) amidotransferase subunit A